jgi:hypothetical protein
MRSENVIYAQLCVMGQTAPTAPMHQWVANQNAANVFRLREPLSAPNVQPLSNSAPKNPRKLPFFGFLINTFHSIQLA